MKTKKTYWAKISVGLMPGYDKPLLFEGKTYNIARFRALKKKKVKESDPSYYDQCTSYMGYKGFDDCPWRRRRRPKRLAIVWRSKAAHCNRTRLFEGRPNHIA